MDHVAIRLEQTDTADLSLRSQALDAGDKFLTGNFNFPGPGRLIPVSFSDVVLSGVDAEVFCPSTCVLLFVMTLTLTDVDCGHLEQDQASGNVLRSHNNQGVFGVLRGLVFQLGASDANRICAVPVELPVMLVASSVACGLLAQQFAVSEAAGEWLIMGVVVFTLLMAAELALGVLFLNRTVAEHFLTELSYSLGLAAQIYFAAFSLFQA